MKKKPVSCSKVYLPVLCAAFALGTVPALLTLTVDPYQMFSQKDRPTKINDIAEKAHYPLWKLAKFKRGSHDTVILGDSRARALRDKYWHELKMTNALNLAYGGGTIPEIYTTFKVIKSDPSIQNLVVGVQLRSFDEDHKGGMNRVPEAVELVRHKFEYLKNWNVFQTTLKMFEKENAETIDKYGSFISQANAGELGSEGKTSLSKLLEPDVCFGCDLPDGLEPIKYPSRKGRYNFSGNGHYDVIGWQGNIPDYGWDRYSAYYQTASLASDLPGKFERQVRKNGASDWRGFEFSQKYWNYFEEMGDWAKQENKNLIFVIPPTITNMQHTIQENGLGKLNHQLRVKLAELGTVMDLDFPNTLTSNIENFNDAYHFDSKIARQIVGQVIPLITKNKDAIGKALKRERKIKCNNSEADKRLKITKQTNLLEGRNCRIWRHENETR
jgi:hypothetical protein